MEVWINKRPGLDFRDYGQLAPYRAEIRSIAKDKKRALLALAAVRRVREHDAALLADSFKGAFSGRLEWVPTGTPDVRGNAGPGRLEYTTGQYWPTEYRKAAASVLEAYDAALSRKWAAESPQKFKFSTVADVKAANKLIGNHWFDPGTMRFFNTRIVTGLLTRGASGRQFFVTSERGPDERTRYTVREACADGTIDTFGKFQAYESLDAAHEAIKAIA